MKKRTIYAYTKNFADRWDICEEFDVILVDYMAGPIDYDEEKPVSRTNVIEFAIDKKIADWESTLLPVAGIFNGRTLRIVFPDEEDKFHEGPCRITDRSHKDGVFYFTVTQEAKPFKQSRFIQTLSNAGHTIERDPETDAWVVYNPGTAPCRFVFKNYSAAENGYLALITDDDYFAVGDPEEMDTTRPPADKLIFNEEMDNMTSWRINEVAPPRGDGIANGAFEPTKYGATMSGQAPSPWEEGQHWHGPTGVKKFKTDILNEDYANNFSAKFKLTAYPNRQKTEGGKRVFRVIYGILDQNDDFMMTWEVRDGSWKYNSLTFEAHAYLADGSRPRVAKFNEGPNFQGSFDFDKQGNTLKFSVFGNQTNDKWTKNFSYYTTDFEAAGRKATSAFVWIAALRDYKLYDYLEATQMRVQKYYRSGQNNIKNILGPRDIFKLDTHTGRRSIGYITLDIYGGSPTETYEPMNDGLNLISDVALELKPGRNLIYVDRSSWYPYSEDVISFTFRPQYY